MPKYLMFISISILALNISCKKDNPVSPLPKDTQLEEYNASTTGLKDFYSPTDYFHMGVAIEPSALENNQAVNLIKRHFNSLTCENAMKWSSLQPSLGTFCFSNADKIVNFAQQNGMKVRGHTLVWHQQVPNWVFTDEGTTVSKETLLARMRSHIDTVVKHFKGKVYAWDVVNEAIDDGSNTYRASNWYNICGIDYIIEAFKAARAADPDAKLFYNDYSAINPGKRDKIFALLQILKEQNLVDGIGLQGHWNINYPPDNDITEALNKYKSLGIDIHITEMDVSVYPNNSDPKTAYTTIVESNLNYAYSRFFKILRQYKADIGNVTFWGLTDGHSWLNNWPVQGRDNYPLLFDRSYVPKKAYFSIIDF